MSHGYTLNTNGDLVSPYSLDGCSKEKVAAIWNSAIQSAQSNQAVCTAKEKKMNRVNIEDISVNIEAKAQQTDESQREYLASRAESVYTQKWVDLRKQYAMDDDEPPYTVKEAVERITSGKFIPPTEEEVERHQNWGTHWTRQITWRDPQKPADKEGFKAAAVVLDQMYRDAKDDIRIQTPEHGLKTLRAFRDAEVTIA